MAFPSTPQLTDFTILGDAGPPPTASYDNGFLFDSMVIASGLCAVDPASMSGYGDAPYLTELSLPVEAWVILGPRGGDPYASVYVYDDSKVYIFNWRESGGDIYYLLADESYSILWSSLNEYSTLTEGSGLGIRATGSQIECYISPDGSTWSAIHTESITLSGLVQIGLGSSSVATFTSFGGGHYTVTSIAPISLSSGGGYNLTGSSRYEIWYANSAGTRLALLAQVGGFEYAKVLNDVGAWSVNVPLSFDRSLIRKDARLEFWRAYPGGALYLDHIGFLRKANLNTDSNGKTSIRLSGPDLQDIINRRYVLYYSGSAQATATDEAADDLCKRIIKENHGGDATDTERDWSSYGLSIAADLTAAQLVTQSFHYENVLKVCQDIAELSQQKGTPLYFGLVPLSPTSFEFQTKVNVWGQDRTAAGLQGVLAMEFGNLADPSLELDWSDEKTHVTALGRGQGVSQQVRDAEDTSRSGASRFGRIESVVNASGEDNSAGVADAAKSALEKARGRLRFKGRLVQTRGFVYGRDWNFGDKLAWRYLDQAGSGIIRSIRVSVDGNGKETIEARMETEE